MAIIGAHALLYTSQPEALRATLRDDFGFRHVDAGEGWLIFALPPAELGVHPAEGPTDESGTRHQLTFMCDDIEATIRQLRAKGITVRGEPRDEGYGITTTLVLPGDVEVMLYQPRHATAIGRSRNAKAKSGAGGAKAGRAARRRAKRPSARRKTTSRARTRRQR